MLQDQALLCSASRHVDGAADGVEMRMAKVPVGRCGIFVGVTVKGDASKVLGVGVGHIYGLFRLVNCKVVKDN